MNTVKSTTTVAAVMNSFFLGIKFSSNTRARAKASAPRSPPYDIISMSIRVNSRRRRRFARFAKSATPKDNEMNYRIRIMNLPIAR